ncbi:hypothetical protein K445DRAFT_314664 [Daldinia sp. EC12]|nr:hypothetical protein K445DRAFT_314664 [Daldinia sp. EC12]
MDHIPLPSDDLGHTVIKVPYLSGGRFPSHCPGYPDNLIKFRTYPDLVGVDYDLLQHDRLKNLSLEDSGPFVQAWLWFGLVHEALRARFPVIPASQVRQLEYLIETVDGHQHLTTSSLLKILSVENGGTRTSLCDPSNFVISIQIALIFINSALKTRYFREFFTARTKVHQIPEIFKVLLASQVLCYTFINVFGLRQAIAPEAAKEGQGSFQLLDYLLDHSGWCSRTIQVIPKDAVLRYHLSFYRRVPACPLTLAGGLGRHAQVDHDCQRWDETSIIPKHTHSQCYCPVIEANVSEIEDSIRQGRIALFRFRKEISAPRVLDLWTVDQREAGAYVAISHVRATGLGNKDSNALPFCQLSLIQSLVDNLDPTSPAGTPFWIDTLSLPRSKTLKKRVLQSTWEIFAHARHVLVLDPPLYQHNFCSPQEALIRIQYSFWKQRLWTLEEGFFAEKLVFRFANCLVSLDELVRGFKDQMASGAGNLVLLEIPASWPPTCELDENDLVRLVRNLADDISEWSRTLESGNDPHILANLQPADKHILRGILRLGFLAASKFQCLLRSDERRKITTVWQALAEVYRPRADKHTNQLHNLSRLLATLSSVNLEEIP